MKELFAKKILVPKDVSNIKIIDEDIFKVISNNWMINEVTIWKEVEDGGEIQELNIVLRRKEELNEA